VPLIDDNSIANDDLLLRRVHRSQWIYDDNLGRSRPTSQAFDTIEMSVDVARIHTAAGRPILSALGAMPDFALTSFQAGLPRAHNLAVCPDPEPANDAHAVVFGKKGKPFIKEAYRTCVWVHSPDNVDPNWRQPA